MMTRMIRAEWMPTPVEKTETQKVIGSIWAKTSAKYGSVSKEMWIAEGEGKVSNPGRCPKCNITLRRENFRANKAAWGGILDYSCIHGCGVLLKITI